MSCPTQTMEQKRLIVRRKDQKDGRRAHIALTEEAETLMRQYLATIHKALMGPGGALMAVCRWPD